MSQNTTDRRMDVAMGLGAPDDPIEVSVILPAYNEEDSVDGIYGQVTDVLEKAGYTYEILFVDDGSTDATWPKIKALAEKDRRVRGLRHRRNFGKATALANGFTYARGEIMVICDADMQYDPNDIMRLIDKIVEGYDVAYRLQGRSPRPAVQAHSVQVLQLLRPHDHRREAARHQRRPQGVHAPGRRGPHPVRLRRAAPLLHHPRRPQGLHVCEVPVESLYRTNGPSKYGVERYMRGALDFLTVFFLVRLRRAPAAPARRGRRVVPGFGAACFAYLGWVGWCCSESIGGRPLLILGALFLLTGVQLLVFGLLAEMINNLERPSGRFQDRPGPAHRAPLVDRARPGVQVERRTNRRASEGARDNARAAHARRSRRIGACTTGCSDPTTSLAPSSGKQSSGAG